MWQSESAPFIVSIHEQRSGEAVQVYGVSDVNQGLHVDVVYDLRASQVRQPRQVDCTHRRLDCSAGA
jgi:hypothetical protein